MSTAIPQTALHVVQISDCHLGEREGEALLGMDTDRSLEAVLQQLGAAHGVPDVLVVSGDVSSDGQVGAYRRLKARLAGAAPRIVWMPGNHDNAQEMRRVVGDELMPAVVELKGWQLLFLNSAVPGQVGGRLAESELGALRNALRKPLPTVVFLHHHLLPVGCAWLDEQRVENAAQVREILRGQPQVKALVCGHVHQESDQQVDGLRQLTTPSSCIQFAPGSREFALDSRNPGYRCFKLLPDGQLKTRVSRVEGMHFHVDRSASGYR